MTTVTGSADDTSLASATCAYGLPACDTAGDFVCTASGSTVETLQDCTPAEACDPVLGCYPAACKTNPCTSTECPTYSPTSCAPSATPYPKCAGTHDIIKSNSAGLDPAVCVSLGGQADAMGCHCPTGTGCVDGTNTASCVASLPPGAPTYDCAAGNQITSSSGTWPAGACAAIGHATASANGCGCDATYTCTDHGATVTCDAPAPPATATFDCAAGNQITRSTGAWTAGDCNAIANASPAGAGCACDSTYTCKDHGATVTCDAASPPPPPPPPGPTCTSMQLSSNNGDECPAAQNTSAIVCAKLPNGSFAEVACRPSYGAWCTHANCWQVNSLSGCNCP